MTEIKLPSGEYLLVGKISGNAIIEVVNFDEKKSWLRWYIPDWSDNGNTDLPPGNWELIGRGSDIKPAIWHTIVEKESQEGYIDYKDYLDEFEYHVSPIESGHSLIASHNLKPEQVVLLKKQA